MKKIYLLLSLIGLSFACYSQSPAVKARIQEAEKIRKTLSETIRQAKEEPHMINIMEINLWYKPQEGDPSKEKITCFFGLEWKRLIDKEGMEAESETDCDFVYLPRLIRREWISDEQKNVHEYLFTGSDNPTLIHVSYTITDVSTGKLLQEIHNYYDKQTLIWGISKQFKPNSKEPESVEESTSTDNDLTGGLFDLRYATMFMETLQKLACNIR
ncbi:MAG: hypothetical protein Q3998_07635 [Porphyromonas sp.]|nr:hypothetical protein [Porphyromonas sp.]